jgi:hypothetical protein
VQQPALAKAIEANSTLTTIILRSNEISNEGAKALATTLRYSLFDNQYLPKRPVLKVVVGQLCPSNLVPSYNSKQPKTTPTFFNRLKHRP